MDNTSREQAELLLQQRQTAREQREFAIADALRSQIEELGFLVVDASDGPELQEKPPYALTDIKAGFADYAADAQVAVTVIVDGWAADSVMFANAVLEHEPASVHLLLIDVSGDVDVALVLEQLASQSDRITVVHLADDPGWADAHAAAALACCAPLYGIADMSSLISGPAISVCAAALINESTLAAIGWRGANVDQGDAWRTVVAVDAGDCDVLMSYLMVMRTQDALDVPAHPKARFYRNADIEWCLRIRERHFQKCGTAARMLVLGDALPVTQGRHHGYHDSDEQMRERESRKTYDRILAAFRGRAELLGR